MNKITELKSLPTPCYVIDKEKLIQNLKILHEVEQRTGAKILLAQKAFSCYHVYPLIGKYLSGTACSGLFEARLGFEEMGKEGYNFQISKYLMNGEKENEIIYQPEDYRHLLE